MAISLRPSAISRPSLPPQPSSSPSPLPRTQFRLSRVSLPTTSLSLLTLLTSPHEVKALNISKEEIVTSLTQVEKTVDQVLDTGSAFFDTAQRVFQAFQEAVKPGIDVGLPILQQAGEQAVKIASPAFSEASKKAQEAIQSSGIDTETVMSAAKTVAGAAQQTSKVIDVAKPIASSTIDTISTADPSSIVVAGGVLFLVYLALPPVWSAISFGFRGYKGDLTPAQSLDLLSTSNYILIDIRTEKDKEKAGIPRVPPSAKNRVISIPLEELPNKIKSLVRNSKKVQSEIAALKISYLKKVNKGSKIVILDSYSDEAKTVAKTLTSLGFKNSWIVADGFSGRNGWLQSRLGTDSYKFSFAEIISPSRILSGGGTQRIGTTRLLRGGSD
ncbi:calcium sensing receptor, chloroplastic [Impatiens glandulifera]|uniref:calcium sensing receptor, chloroplastic n=1 Tax=Impatiens glandulifera TaxID=253017 RepID=UPI001FB17198|nr:calcium sensing receptor, chloroplastic [Impatiens glandulifera]